jgi:hypothetical protein
MQCSQNGKISELIHYGLIPMKGDQEAEQDDYNINHCGADENFPQIRECGNKYLDKERLLESWNNTCSGKEKCDFNLPENIKFEEPTNSYAE